MNCIKLLFDRKDYRLQIREHLRNKESFVVSLEDSPAILKGEVYESVTDIISEAGAKFNIINSQFPLFNINFIYCSYIKDTLFNKNAFYQVQCLREKFPWGNSLYENIPVVYKGEDNEYETINE